MGRELARQLVAEGCNVAMCDVSIEAMAETKRLCEVEKLPQGLRVTTHVADVSIEDQLKRFRDELAEQQATDKIHLLFNNAGIGGGGSLFTNTREQWERTFNICWGGVYLGVRTFLPMLLKADEGHIVNTSSVNGFWASVGMGVSHTAYSAAKFAVKGFTEALINDLRLNAPHIKCSVVMPGHIGTSIVSNSRKILSGSNSEQLEPQRNRAGAPAHERHGHRYRGRCRTTTFSRSALDRARSFREDAPMTAAAAAKIILDGVKAERWRILVGDDAHSLDERVRQTPERAYDADFFQELRRRSGLAAGVSRAPHREDEAGSPVHDRLRDHAVNALGAVDGLRHAQIGGQAAERVGVLARQIALFAEQHDHVAQRPHHALVEVGIHRHRHVMSRAFRRGDSRAANPCAASA